MTGTAEEDLIRASETLMVGAEKGAPHVRLPKDV